MNGILWGFFGAMAGFVIFFLMWAFSLSSYREISEEEEYKSD